MTIRVPSFGAGGWSPRNLIPHNALPTSSRPYANVERNLLATPGSDYSVNIRLISDCSYDNVSEQMERVRAQSSNAFMEFFKRDFPALIGEEVDKRIASRMAEQTSEITSKIAEVETTVLAKKSLVTLNGSVFGLGKFTEAWTKTIELVQGLRRVGQDTTPSSNVGGGSFFSQIGRSAKRGAKVALNITAGGLGAAVVMSAILATSGLALNKVHEAFPSIPAATQIVSVVKGYAEQLKVSVGSVEIEHVGGEKVKTLTVQERAKALLAQNGNDYGKAIQSVHNALSLSYINEGSVSVISAQEAMLKEIQTLQVAHSAKITAAPSPTSPTP